MSKIKSQRTEVKSTKNYLFENQSRFAEDSIIDQDDSYGNYRPKFQVKNTKVTGRTSEILKLQRMASLDHGKAILGPIQPDLTGEKNKVKRQFPHQDSGNFKFEKEQDQFFRKAVE